MDIFIIALLAALIVLMIVAIVLIIKNKPKEDNGISLLDQKVDINAQRTENGLRHVSDQMRVLTEKNYEQMLRINESLNENAEKQSRRIGESIAAMQESNEKKLEQMRVTVDEKLTETLNQRLNASFRTVSEQLENVYKSLGEMKTLSEGVTDNVKGLNRVLTNVKARGTWAEVQLGNILDETIPGMYETNVQTNPKYNGRVEFAVRIPNSEDDSITYLPIDSKFPMEDYARLSAAADAGNLEELERAKKALERRVQDEAKLIRQYVSTPETTPFAILYLATEGLYAEITSSKSGVAEKLQADGIMIAGPSTITALLNSLAMGFRTMAINKKANEVWKVLGAAKEQYGKFGILLQKAKKKIEEAGKTIDEADHRNEIIQKSLRKVETLDSGEANDILGLEE
ncbi:MAG: DNA recombination protein RmuC [Eubacterium sp.]|nr:DNA recombination protein RmuC [Eubacterium sp.]